MLASLAVAMHIIHRRIKAIHFGPLLNAGRNYLNRHVIRGPTNFIYYGISRVVPILLMPTKGRWKIQGTPPL